MMWNRAAGCVNQSSKAPTVFQKGKSPRKGMGKMKWEWRIPKRRGGMRIFVSPTSALQESRFVSLIQLKRELSREVSTLNVSLITFWGTLKCEENESEFFEDGRPFSWWHSSLRRRREKTGTFPPLSFPWLLSSSGSFLFFLSSKSLEPRLFLCEPHDRFNRVD